MSDRKDKVASNSSIVQQAAQNNPNISTQPNGSTNLPAESNGLFTSVEIEGFRWNKRYPYQLIVVRLDDKFGWTRTSAQFTLPIPPQQLDIDMPFAITTSATLGGIVEEHNGTPFRMISLAGTTGVLPLKGSSGVIQSADPVIFGGTVLAATTALSNANAALGGNKPNIVAEAVFENANDDINKTTGYYQFHVLRAFLENYAAKKKTAEGRPLRLAFASWKDNSVYLVTPMNFRMSRTAASPYEYNYQLSLKAWARISLEGSNYEQTHSPLGREPSGLYKVINTIDQARAALAGYSNILGAVRADINFALFEPLRQVALGLKDIAGVAQKAADLPGDIVVETLQSTLQLINNAKDTSFRASFPTATVEQLSQLISLSVQTTSESEYSQTGTQKNSFTQSVSANPNPIVSSYKNPSEIYGLLAGIDLGSLKLTPATQRKINDEKRKLRLQTRKDFEIKRDSVLGVMTDFADSLGLGGNTYNETFGIVSKQSTVTKEPTDEDLEILFYLNQTVLELNRLCVSNRMDPNTIDTMNYVAGLANRSGVAFQVPASKFSVPMLHSHTLEKMAEIYLGNPDRWIEIATLNGLQEPYVDETGVEIALATNGYANSVQLTSNENLYVGQPVTIYSTTVKRESRRITGLTKIADDTYVVNLSGDADLDKFTVSDRATLHVFLPNTVNSGMSLYIPSDLPTDEEDWKTQQIEGIDYFDSLIRVGGISLLLTPTNDIAFNANGSRLSAGLTNIVQKARIALSTPRGSLLHHKSYGLPVQVGQSTAEVSAKDIFQAVQEMFVNDRTFSGVSGIVVDKTGPVCNITANIGISGVQKTIPISVAIKP